MTAPAARMTRALAALACLVLSAASVAAPAKLPSYNVELRETSVSGISSGGYMAVQFHLAHSSVVRGVGVFAGGPYNCAAGDINQAVATCMEGTPDAAAALEAAKRFAAAGKIDPLSVIARHKIWLFSGYNDGVVRRPVVEQLYRFYMRLTDRGNIFYQNGLRAAHSQVTADYGAACDFTGGNFISDCDYDGAGMLLQHVHGALRKRAPGSLSGKVIEFDQGEFVEGVAWKSGLANTAYAYVPAECAALKPCRVHVAFHGCKQYAGRVGDAFYRRSGYNGWADANGIIVLYPQTVAGFWPFNPNGCWDWWGYTGEDYATQGAPQIKAVRAMLDRLAGRFKPDMEPDRPLAAPSDVVAPDRTATSVALAWSAASGASGYEVRRRSPGGAYVKVNRAPVTGTSFADSGLQPDTGYEYQVVALKEGERAESATVPARTAGPAPACDPYFTDNLTHVNRGRAYVLWGRAYAIGSNEPMGWWNVFTETALVKEGARYRVGTCP
ncbi:MAG: fibronectin type III domain-containing protein [Betaproteobacteria bacterium]|nr:fibronectin type III domain-containing protein [Betaproteobacteria bacterium]